jgi:hypothetical protein
VRLDRSNAIEKQTLLRTRDIQASALDGVRYDGDRIDAAAHQKVRVLGVHRRSLTTDRCGHAVAVRLANDLPDCRKHGLVAFVVEPRETLVVPDLPRAPAESGHSCRSDFRRPIPVQYAVGQAHELRECLELVNRSPLGVVWRLKEYASLGVDAVCMTTCS